MDSTARGTRRAVAALAALVLATTCTESSRRTPTSPSSPAPAQFERLELEGPRTVHPTRPAQFTATAFAADGSSRNVTTEVSWRFDGIFLMQTGPGEFVGRHNGETALSAALAGRLATLESIIVVPEGTYKLSGTVRDGGVPIDADVVVESEGAGESRLRTSGGRYAIYGVAGDTRVEVVKTGYRSAIVRHRMTDHHQIDFDLELAQPRADVAGRYTLTITAAAGCTRLPEELRVRSYGALLEQAGPRVAVTLTDAQFLERAGRTLNTFSGILEPDRLVFDIPLSVHYYFGYYYYFVDLPVVFEVVGPDRFLGLGGTMVATPGSQELAGTMKGIISNFSGTALVTAACRSNNHRFVFTR